MPASSTPVPPLVDVGLPAPGLFSDAVSAKRTIYSANYCRCESPVNVGEADDLKVETSDSGTGGDVTPPCGTDADEHLGPDG